MLQEWYRGFISDCPNGKLSPPAFVKIYSQCFPSGNARDFCDHIFRTFDTDGNGYIDFKEFLLAISVTSSGSPEEKLNWAFRLKDYINNVCQFIPTHVQAPSYEKGISCSHFPRIPTKSVIMVRKTMKWKGNPANSLATTFNRPL